jgi:hypothetical protein
LLLLGVSTAAAAPRLELHIEGQRLEATVIGLPKLDPVMLHDVTRDRRVPPLQVQSASEHGDPNAGDDRFYATFDTELLEGDDKPHELAVEAGGQELARATLVLPGMPAPSNLRWLVIAGPLIGLAMIITAIYIGRRVLKKALASEPRRRPFQ